MAKRGTRGGAGPARCILLVVAYDGTDFKGWQRLPGAARTVQEELERALEAVTGQASRVAGAGRTDAGVHADGQAASLWTDCALPLAELGRALNTVLPADMACAGLREARPGFHARYRAVDKTYAYRLLDGSGGRSERRWSFKVPKPLDDRAMIRAAAAFEGPHRFRAFTNAKSDALDFRRTLAHARVERAGPAVDILFTADGFLYNQARLMAASVLAAGQGRMNEDGIRRALDSGDRAQVPGALGAFGLRLVSVGFREDDFLGPLLVPDGAGGLPPYARPLPERSGGPRP